MLSPSVSCTWLTDTDPSSCVTKLPLCWSPRGAAPFCPQGLPPIVSAWRLSLCSPCGVRRVAGVDYPIPVSNTVPADSTLECEQNQSLKTSSPHCWKRTTSTSYEQRWVRRPCQRRRIMCFRKRSKRSPRDRSERALMSLLLSLTLTSLRDFTPKIEFCCTQGDSITHPFLPMDCIVHVLIVNTIENFRGYIFLFSFFSFLFMYAPYSSLLPSCFSSACSSSCLVSSGVVMVSVLASHLHLSIECRNVVSKAVMTESSKKCGPTFLAFK